MFSNCYSTLKKETIENNKQVIKKAICMYISPLQICKQESLPVAKVARTSKRSTPGKKEPMAKAVAAKKTPMKKASVKSLKPKAAIA
uniref:Histone H1/H5 n=1 Tax=Tanacetum cinerariifolium TaxID=118510 RepID=A0A699SIU3_TANCI|nr:histone H1/H5 [Tanacetum cinerariifolium]